MNKSSPSATWVRAIKFQMNFSRTSATSTPSGSPVRASTTGFARVISGSPVDAANRTGL